MLPNAGDRLVTIEFDDLCSSDPSLEANLLRSIEKVTPLERLNHAVTGKTCRSTYGTEPMLHAGCALRMSLFLCRLMGAKAWAF